MKAKWHGRPYHDIALGKWLITFETDESPDVFDKTRDKELTVEVKQYRNKRSLDANEYCWVLCTEIAKVINSSKDEVYEQAINDYAPLDRREDGGLVTVTMLKIIPVKLLGGHWKILDDTRGKFNVYMRLKGSSEMNSAEMSHFLDGLVSDAKELGIETDTPEQIERMKSLWKAS